MKHKESAERAQRGGEKLDVDQTEKKEEEQDLSDWEWSIHKSKRRTDTDTEHAALSWVACYDDECNIHKGDKDGHGWFPRAPTKHHRNISWRACYNDQCRIHKAEKLRGGFFPKKWGQPKKIGKHVHRSEQKDWRGDKKVRFADENWDIKWESDNENEEDTPTEIDSTTVEEMRQKIENLQTQLATAHTNIEVMRLRTNENETEFQKQIENQRKELGRERSARKELEGHVEMLGALVERIRDGIRGDLYYGRW